MRLRRFSADLPRSAIHGDLNDFNVLVDGDHVSGFVDFGDMVYGYTVGDLAIAAAYVMLDSADPIAVVSQMARGYQTQCPLSETELAALFPLAVLRLCTSACVAAHQQRERPDNAYLGVSQAAIRRTLPRLARVPLPERRRANRLMARDADRLRRSMDLPSREVAPDLRRRRFLNGRSTRRHRAMGRTAPHLHGPILSKAARFTLVSISSRRQAPRSTLRCAAACTPWPTMPSPKTTARSSFCAHETGDGTPVLYAIWPS